MNDNHRSYFSRLALAGVILLTLPVHAGNPLWNGAGSVTNNFFSNTNNWVPGSVPVNDSINGLPVNFGPLAVGATNTANCDAVGNSGIWTFNSGAAAMVVTLNATNNLGVAAGPDVFVNNSTNLQTITGAFRLFDIAGTTTTRRFNAAAGPLAIIPSQISIRGDAAPVVWAIELGGAFNGTLNTTFANVNYTNQLNYLKTGAGTWEIISPLPNLTANAATLTVMAGTLTLDAANTYTGPTIVSNGATLNTVTFSTGGGAYAVSNSATLGVTISAVGSSLTNASLTLGTTGTDSTTLNFGLGGFGSLAQPVLAVTGALTVNGTGVINFSGGGLPVGQFPVIRYGSQSGAAGFGLGTLPTGMTATLSNNVANSSIDLVVSGDNNLLYWNGDLSAGWDINTTANWQIRGLGGQFYQEGDAVVFDDTASGNYAVTLNSAVHPQTVTVSNNVNSYSLSGSGSIGWTAGLLKTGSNVLTLSVANNFFAGPVTVAAGALALNNLTAVTGPGGLNIADGAVVQPKLGGTYASVVTTLNGSSTANGSYGGALDFRNGSLATWPGKINLNSDTATIGCYGAACTVNLSGQLTGSGSLTFRPEGGNGSSHTAIFTLSNPSNNYAGNTTMQVGTAELSATLKAGTNNALPVTTTLNLDRVGNSGVVYFDLAGFTQTVSSLTADFTSNAVINSTGTAGTLVVSNNAADTFTGDLGVVGTANFSLVKTGGGTLTLGGPNNYTGTTTFSNGVVQLNGLVTATGGLLLGSDATLMLALGQLAGGTNMMVNGNVTLAGQLTISDFGIVSNTAYPVIYYSGTLNTNGLRLAPPATWAFTLDTSVPHLVRIIPTQAYPMLQFAALNQTVSNSLQLNVSGTLRGFPVTPVYYEVHLPNGQLTDFGAVPPTPNWQLPLRHLVAGTNNVRVFTANNLGVVQQVTTPIVLQLGNNPPVRPRPYPAEIWWGGVATDLAPQFGYDQLTDPTRPWDFVKKYQDGIFLHGGLPPDATLTKLASVVAPYNSRFGREGGFAPTVNPNYAANDAAALNSQTLQLAQDGVYLTFYSCDYNPGMKPWVQGGINPGWCDNWPNWTHAQLLNSNMQTWADFVPDMHTNWPGLKLGWTWSPVYFNWGGYPSTIGPDALTLHPVVDANGIVVTNQYGTNAWFDFDMLEFFNQASTTAQAGDGYWGFASDCPYDYFAQWSNAAAKATNQAKIFAYETWERTNGYFPTTICNYSQANSPDTNIWDEQFSTNSLNYLVLKQQLGGRTQKYLFESWYSGPYTWAPESDPYSFSGTVLQAIKYLKGIKDTNGTLEGLSLTLLSSGATNLIQLQNNGDVTCLPAVTATDSGGTGTVAYYNAAGSNITSAILSAEGYVHTNLLAPGQTTTISIVPSVQPLNRAITLEAFWNPQDPTGVVRSRLIVTQSNTPPVLATNADVTLIAGQTLIVTNTATDTNLPAQTLTFSLVSGPAGMTVNPTNGILVWRPAVAQAPSTNLVTVQVSDDGTPPLSATQSFQVIVTVPATPTFAAPALSGQGFSMLVNGSTGPDYYLQSATNLTAPVAWLPLQTNLSATPPFLFTDPSATNFSQRFYRVLLGP